MAWNLAGCWKFLTDAGGISIRRKEEFLRQTHSNKRLKEQREKGEKNAFVERCSDELLRIILHRLHNLRRL